MLFRGLWNFTVGVVGERTSVRWGPSDALPIGPLSYVREVDDFIILSESNVHDFVCGCSACREQ